MRRRNYVAGTVVAAVSIAAGAGMAVAAAPAAAPKAPKVKPVVLKCNTSLTTEPPAGSNSVEAPALQGSQYGPSHCARKGFGWGVAGDKFTVPDSGDTVGTFVLYFHAGSVAGTFDVTPQEGGVPDPNTFQAVTYTGVFKVFSGTGIYKGIKQKKGTGVMNCSSPDGVHLTCHEKIKVFLPATI